MELWSFTLDMQSSNMVRVMLKKLMLIVVKALVFWGLFCMPLEAAGLNHRQARREGVTMPLLEGQFG